MGLIFSTLVKKTFQAYKTKPNPSKPTSVYFSRLLNYLRFLITAKIVFYLCCFRKSSVPVFQNHTQPPLFFCKAKPRSISHPAPSDCLRYLLITAPPSLLTIEGVWPQRRSLIVQQMLTKAGKEGRKTTCHPLPPSATC